MVDRNVAEQKVRWPAIGMLVTAVLCILLQLAIIVATLLGVEFPGMEQYQRDIPQWAEWMSGGMNIALALFGIAVSGFMIFGSIKLMRLESYGIALATAIIAMIPCSVCCCIGLPFGIWALIVMHAPDVRPAFQGAAQPGGPVT
jgi:hypothetical protein